ncbi:MAG: phosphatidylglycerophosphatase A [Acidithiobacillus sp.]
MSTSTMTRPPTPPTMLWNSWEYSDYRVLEFGTGYYSVRHCLGRMAGFFPTLWALPFSWWTLTAGFLFLRFFDMLNPWPISRLDRRICTEDRVSCWMTSRQRCRRC